MTHVVRAALPRAAELLAARIHASRGVFSRVTADWLHAATCFVEVPAGASSAIANLDPRESLNGIADPEGLLSTATNRLASLLAGGTRHEFVLEHPMASRGDPYLADVTAETVYMNDVPHFVLQGPHASAGEIRELVDSEGAMGFVAGIFRDRRDWQREAVSPQVVLVDAFDGEAWILARPSVEL